MCIKSHISRMEAAKSIGTQIEWNEFKKLIEKLKADNKKYSINNSTLRTRLKTRNELIAKQRRIIEILK